MQWILTVGERDVQWILTEVKKGVQWTSTVGDRCAVGTHWTVA